MKRAARGVKKDAERKVAGEAAGNGGGRGEQKPWLTSTKIAAITVLIFIAIMFLSANKIWPEIQQRSIYGFKEGPLEKMPLALKPGERYAYVFKAGNQSMNITYLTAGGPGCVTVTLAEVKNTQTTCIKPDGTDEGGSNLALSNKLVYFFKPWMLAVREGWDWEVKMTMNITEEKVVEVFRLQTINTSLYKGREAFVVSGTEENDNSPVIITIDKEKRVMLREEGGGYEIDLVSAPFPLRLQGE